ncbi:MAG: hypothetical protein JXO22_18135 [Phycisphaerae bacterium]|nr:hypothetical protein [Phycisphaerae bacterium]
MLGPATGLLQAAHLAHAGHHHNADKCHVCQQLIATSKYMLDPPADIPATADKCPRTVTPPATTLSPQFAPLSNLARGPPSNPIP